MSSIKEATISGYNEYIQTLKNKGTAMDFSLARFNGAKFDVGTAKAIADVGQLTDYAPNNGTPLYDSLAKFIKHIENVPLRSPQVLMVIMTDGEENESKEFNKAKIFALIKEKEKAGWIFTFLGANQDAWAEAGAMGMSMGNSVNFQATPQGMKQAFQASANMTAFVTQNVERGMAFDKVNLFNAKNVNELLADEELDPNAVTKI